MEQENIMAYATVTLDEMDQTLVIIDQTKLPAERVMLRLNQPEDIWQAIHTLQVRGAPAIGVAAAIGLYAAAYQLKTTDTAQFCTRVQEIWRQPDLRPSISSGPWSAWSASWRRQARQRSMSSKNGCMMKRWQSRKRTRGSADRSENMA